MDTISLGNTGRSTTRLGFGCSSIMGSIGRRESLRILEVAWDAGIRHFDVAPLYGYGEAEACLGEFLQRHRGGTTVTTKFGIEPASSSPMTRFIRSSGRSVLGQFPGLKQRLKRDAVAAPLASLSPVDSAPTSRPPNPIFCVDCAKRSLERSLAALRSDHIDVWLLHEVTAADLATDELLRFLEESVQSGQIGTFGAGTDRNQIDALLRLHPEYCPTVQYEWSILNPIPDASPAFRMHHRSLTNNFRGLHATLLLEGDRCSRWSERTGVDLARPAVLAQLMVKAAMLFNPASVILFSSKSAAHIQANVALAGDDSLAPAAATLYGLLHEEPGV